MVEYIIIVGVVALAAIIAFSAFAKEEQALSARQGQCVQGMQCGEGSSFPSSNLGSGGGGAGSSGGSGGGSAIGRAAGAVWDGYMATNSFLVGFAKGVIVDVVWGTVTGVAELAYNLATDPVGTVAGIGNGIAYVVTNPGTVAGSVWDSVEQGWKEDPGRLTANIVAIVVPVTKVKLLATAGRAGKLAEGAKVADAAGDAARAGKAADAAGAAGKTEGAVAKAADEASCPGGVCTGGSCFGPGTPVTTPEGERPIETIAPGDLVLARDPETGETAPRRVVRLFITPDREVLDLGLEQDDHVEHLVVTPEHPFWREGSGFVGVSDLVPGDLVRTAAGVTRVRSLASLPQHITVYNFEVETAHTYFVGKTAAWVHNACTGPLGVGDDVLIPRSDGTISGGKIVGQAGDGKVVVEVRTADGRTGTKIVSTDQLARRRAVGEEVGVPRSDGSTSVGKVVLRHDDGSVTVQWEANGQTMTKTVPERALQNVDAARAAGAGGKYASAADGYKAGPVFDTWMGPRPLPDQGWKLHISAGAEQSQEVANRILPELRAMGVTHKVTTDAKTYDHLNKGGQAGKFITIYPDNAEHAAEIARRLDKNLGDIKATGPVVDGERAIGSSGFVYGRYGSFVDPNNIRNPYTGALEPDVRGRAAPDWAGDPFAGL
jgi:hypothetical protein